MRKEISFVIPSYRSETTLPACLHALYSQPADVPFEVIVVDSSEIDREKEYAFVFPRLRWLYSEPRLSPGEARNRGLALAQAPWVVFLDSDVVLDPDWILQADRCWHDDYSALLGHLRPYPERNLWGWCLFLIQFSFYFPGTARKEISVAASYALLTRTEDARKAGGFPEDHPVLEDYAFCLRLLRTTAKPILFHPALGACHINKRGWRNFYAQLRHHGQWAAQVRRQPDFPGHFLIRYPFLVLTLPLYRLLSTGARTFRWGWRAFARYLLCSPILLLGFCLWAWAFFRQALRQKK